MGHGGLRASAACIESLSFIELQLIDVNNMFISKLKMCIVSALLKAKMYQHLQKCVGHFISVKAPGFL